MDKQFPVDETDSSSLGGDSPEHVEAMNLAETPKSLVSFCKSAISLPKLGVSNLRTSMTPSKMGPVPDFNQKPTQKRELLDDHEPHSFKVRTRKLAYFHFSHYKSIETLRCHSNQSSYLTGIKITNYVEASVRNMYTKYKIHPLDSF